MPVPLEALAHGADLVVIATALKPRHDGEMAALKVERTLKGKPTQIVSLVEPDDPSFLCDISGAEPGERALFLLDRAAKGFQIMAFGRGKLPISADGKTVTLFSRHDYYLSEALDRACDVNDCPLDDVLGDLTPWFVDSQPTAFLVERYVRGVAPSALRCEPPTKEQRFWVTCRLDAADASASISLPERDTNCFAGKDATFSCIRVEPAAPRKKRP